MDRVQATIDVEFAIARPTGLREAIVEIRIEDQVRESLACVAILDGAGSLVAVAGSGISVEFGAWVREANDGADTGAVAEPV